MNSLRGIRVIVDETLPFGTMKVSKDLAEVMREQLSPTYKRPAVPNCANCEHSRDRGGRKLFCQHCHKQKRPLDWCVKHQYDGAHRSPI